MVCERPAQLHRDPMGRLHNIEGLAIAWPDGWGLYSINGVRVPARVVEQPETITIEEIDAEQNAEIRRVMIERYGSARWLKDSGAKLVQQDERGELYERNIAGRSYRFVKVINSTPEPDGSRKEYALSLPPTTTTAQEGVAWTFGLQPHEYNPVWES